MTMVIHPNQYVPETGYMMCGDTVVIEDERPATAHRDADRAVLARRLMQSLHPVLKRGGLFWDRALLPPTLFADRYKRIQAAIAEAGDDAWLVYGDAQRYGDAGVRDATT